MKKLNHTNVVRLIEVIDPPDDDKLILMLDFCANGEILDWDEMNARFKPYSESEEEFSES